MNKKEKPIKNKPQHPFNVLNGMKRFNARDKQLVSQIDRQIGRKRVSDRERAFLRLLRDYHIMYFYLNAELCAATKYKNTKIINNKRTEKFTSSNNLY